jgi:nucleotide-binding universal stress UspA family protein
MNLNIRTIVVGVDFSAYSKLVVKEAKQLAKKLNASIVYVYVFEDIYLFDSARVQMAEDYQRAIRKTYKLKAKDRVIVSFGQPHAEILKVGKMFSKPLIMLGHRGHNAFTRFFLGSTAERLTLMSPYPVWIHRGKKTGLPKKVLIPCDFSTHAHHKVKKLANLKRTFNANLEAYHVFQEPMPILDYQIWQMVYEEMKKNEEQMLRSFKRRHPQLKTKVVSGNVSQKILDRAKAFDLVALYLKAKKNRSAFGSITNKLIRSSQRPLLVIP